MLINGLDFIFGKDLTRTFRRIMYDSREAVRIAGRHGEGLSIYFYPKGNTINNEVSYITLERGVIGFPVSNSMDLLDASNLLHIIQGKSGEQIGNLQEIVEIRGYVNT